MPKINIADIRTLRERTGGSLADCKRELEAHGGDLDAATAALARVAEDRAATDAAREAQAAVPQTLIERVLEWAAPRADGVAGVRRGASEEELSTLGSLSGRALGPGLRVVEHIENLGDNHQASIECVLRDDAFFEGRVYVYVYRDEDNRAVAEGLAEALTERLGVAAGPGPGGASRWVVADASFEVKAAPDDTVADGGMVQLTVAWGAPVQG